jgi:hypothetical protein
LAKLQKVGCLCRGVCALRSAPTSHAFTSTGGTCSTPPHTDPNAASRRMREKERWAGSTVRLCADAGLPAALAAHRSTRWGCAVRTMSSGRGGTAEDVQASLRKVMEPDLESDVVTLEFIRNIRVDGASVSVGKQLVAC